MYSADIYIVEDIFDFKWYKKIEIILCIIINQCAPSVRKLFLASVSLIPKWIAPFVKVNTAIYVHGMDT
jgi:hypothetical protein